MDNYKNISEQIIKLQRELAVLDSKRAELRYELSRLRAKLKFESTKKQSIQFNGFKATAENRYLDVKKDFKTTLKELIDKYSENFGYQGNFKNAKGA